MSNLTKKHRIEAFRKWWNSNPNGDHRPYPPKTEDLEKLIDEIYGR